MIVSYEYVINGKHYRSRQLFWGDTGVTSSRDAIEQRRLKYQLGRQCHAYYNPRKPQESVLERSLHNSTYTVLAIGSMALLIALFFGTVIFPSALEICGIKPTSTHVRSGAPPWCERTMKGVRFW